MVTPHVSAGSAVPISIRQQKTRCLKNEKFFMKKNIKVKNDVWYG
jgi:hypothetical protein